MAIQQNELERIYAEIEQPIYNFALRWIWDPARAEELVQDAFVRVWQRRHAVEAATLKGLLFKTVQNLALNERRGRRLRERLSHWLGGEPDDGHVTAESGDLLPVAGPGPGVRVYWLVR